MGADAFVCDVGDWLAGELAVVGECVVDEVEESEHESSLGEDVVVSAADGDLVGVEVSVDVDGVGVDPDAFLVGDGAGVEDGTGAEEEVLAVGAVAFVLEGYAYCEVYHVVSLEVEVGFGAGVCGVGGSFEVACGVGVESVGVFAESRVGDSTVAEGDLPVGVSGLLEAAAVA